MEKPDYPFFRFIGFGDRVFVTREPIRSSATDGGFDQVIRDASEAWDWEGAMIASRLGFLVGDGKQLTVQYAADSALQDWANENGYQLEFEAI